MTSRTEPRRRGRLIVPALLLAAAILILLYLQCAGGLGLGRGSNKPGAQTPRPAAATVPATAAAPADAGAPARCQLRVDATGITAGGAPASLDEAVAACRAAGTADVVVTGDARQGAWDELRGALEGAAIQTYVRGAGAAPDPGPPPRRP